MNICPICKKSFFTPNKRKVYCSQLCSWRRITERRRKTPKNYLLAEQNRTKPFDYNTKQIIYGSLLGDGCLIKTTNGYRFSIGQCERFLPYLEWKKSKTTNIFQQEKPCRYQHRIGSFHYYYHSISHPEFNKIYKLFYIKKIKCISQKILNNIDELALAIWYQDDGSYNHNKNSKQIFLCTDSYTLKEHQLLQKWFMKKWNIETKIQYIKSSVTTFGTKKSCYRIRINRKEVPKFIMIIKDFIQYSMFHKLPTNLSC